MIQKLSVIIFYSGNVNNEVNFDYEDGPQMVEDGCGATLNGEFWYFGGYYWGEIRQVSSFNHNL